VGHQTVRHGVGRPRHIYDLAAAAQSLFPSNYDGLAIDLLAAVEQVGGSALVAEVFAARRAQVADRIRFRMAERLPTGAPLVDRVRELAVIQDELGYLADVTLEPDGAIRLREHNCAIYDVACDQPAACQAELDLFREVLGGQVVRETHIAAGDRCCCYAIAESPPSTVS
jgi:predicted ArsR family transcriptional regulator